MAVAIIVIILCTIGIWWCSEQLSHGTDTIGKIYNISPGVRGATLDAVASSFPEFCTVIFALIAGHFDAGVGTIAGSALFNILVIPALASLAVGGLVVRSEVVKRDGVLYVVVVIAFIAIFFFGADGSKAGNRIMPAWAGFAALIAYCAYVFAMVLQARQFRARLNKEEAESDAIREAEATALAKDLSIPGAVGRLVVGMAGVGVACHYLVHYGLELMTGFGFSPAVAGVTVLAAATSLPDTLLSVFAARRGDADGAIANAFASNTFDILICLGLPILIMGGLEMNWDDGWPVLICLLISSIGAVFLMITDWRISVGESIFKIALYLAFCTAIFLGWL